MAEALPFEFVESDTMLYRLLSKLGEGGMGKVYLAETVNASPAATAPGKKVAIKFLDLDEAEQQVRVQDRQQYREEMLTRFQTEGRLGFRLRHLHIVRILDYGTDEFDRPFLVCEYVDGARPLSALRDLAYVDHMQHGRCRAPDGRILQSLVPQTVLLTLASQVADAIAFMHENKAVHRDIKPENVVFVHEVKKVHAYVLDLGIAKLMDGNSNKLTLDGRIVGTPTNMAPEQLGPITDQDKKDWPVGPWTDVYALGTLIYELLTGQMCFELAPGDDAWKLMGLVRNGQPTPLSKYVADANPELEALVTRCLSKQPWLRPTAIEARDILRKLLEIPNPAEPSFSFKATRRVVSPDAPTMAGPSHPPPPPPQTVTLTSRPVSKPPPNRLLPIGMVLTVGVAGAWLAFGSQPIKPQPTTLVASASVSASASIDRVTVSVVPTASASTVRPKATASVSARPPAASAPATPSPLPNPNAADKEEKRMAKIFSNGESAFAQKNWARAEIAMRLVLGDPRFANAPKVILLEGECLLRLDRKDEAKSHLKRYLAFPGKNKNELSPEARTLLNL